MATIRTALSLLTEGQASAEITQNTLNNVFDTLLGAANIQQNGLNTPPGSPSDGDAYIIGGSPTGDWASNANDFTVYFNGWIYISPFTGMQCWDNNDNELIQYDAGESLWYPVQQRWSTTEHWTGRYRESSKVYAKVVDCGTLPSTPSTPTTTAHSISTIDFSKPIVIQTSLVDNTNDVAFYGNIFAYPGDVALVQVNTTNVVAAATSDLSAFQLDVYLEYCKV